MSQVVKYMVECWAWGTRVIRQPWRPDWPAMLLRLEQLAALAGLLAVILTAGGDSRAWPAGNSYGPHGGYRLTGSYLTVSLPPATTEPIDPAISKPGAQASPPAAPNDRPPTGEPKSGDTPGAAPPQQSQPAPEPRPQAGLQPLRQVTGAGHRVALTFDDGPAPGWTERYLKVLAAMDTRATFFMVGSRAAANAALVQAVLAGHNEVASHSWVHANLGKVSREAARDDLNQAATTLAGITGQPVKYFRPPYGAMGPNLLAAAGDLGERTVTWSVDPRDWSNPGPPAVIKRVLANVHDGSIILLHEAHPGTLAALPELIKDLRERGYELVTVSELIAAGKEK